MHVLRRECFGLPQTVLPLITVLAVLSSFRISAATEIGSQVTEAYDSYEEAGSIARCPFASADDNSGDQTASSASASSKTSQANTTADNGDDTVIEDAASIEVRSFHLPRLAAAEGNGTLLSLLLEAVKRSKSSDTFLVALFYAKWCPFSQALLPTFDVLAKVFEDPHVVFLKLEEEAIRPSSLSRFGVHSFPVVHIYSKAMRHKYMGPRTLESMVASISNITGREPGVHKERTQCQANTTLLDHVFCQGRENGTKKCPYLGDFKVDPRFEQACPYRWVFEPQSWGSSEMYLSLATAFVALRLGIFVLKKTHRRLRRTSGAQDVPGAVVEEAPT